MDAGLEIRALVFAHPFICSCNLVYLVLLQDFLFLKCLNVALCCCGVAYKMSMSRKTDGFDYHKLKCGLLAGHMILFRDEGCPNLSVLELV